MRAVVLASLFAAAGCVTTPTQLLVFVETDLDREAGEIDGFVVTVRGPDGEAVPLDDDTFSLDRVTLPASFGVAPVGRDAHRSVEVEVAARLGGQTLFSTRARTGYVEGEVQRLDMFLARRCRTEGQVCEALELTCDAGGCRDPEEPPGGSTGGATPEWEHVFAAPLLDPVVGDTLHVAVDGASNVVVAGSFNGTLTIDGTVLDHQGDTDGFVVELPAEGDGARWFAHLHGDPDPEDQSADFVGVQSVAVDVRTGQTSVAGSFSGALVVGDQRVDALGDLDGFVVTFDEDGGVLEIVILGAEDGTVDVQDVDVGTGGERAVAGSFQGARLPFGDVELDAGGGTSLFAGLLDGAAPYGCALSTANGAGVAVGPNGRMFVCGIGDDGSRLVLSTGPDCVFTTLTIGASTGAELRVDVDEAGRAVMAGGISDATFDGVPLEGVHQGSDGLVVAVAPDGSRPLWHRFIGSDDAEDLHDVVMSPEGTAYVAGSIDGRRATVDGWPEPLEGVGNTDGVAAAFAPDGTTLWARSWATDAREHWSGIAYDAVTGAVVIVGYGFSEDAGIGVAVARLVP